jgi:uncharacterized membrane protein
MSYTSILLFTTSLCCALISGLLYSFVVAINPGLAKLNDQSYIEGMKSINIAIQNPLFFISFMGTLVLLPVSTYVFRSSGISWFLAVATILYIIGVFGVTIFGNIPLNNSIESFNIDSKNTAQTTSLRTQYQTSWNYLHNIRTIASISSLVFILIAMLNYQNL